VSDGKSLEGNQEERAKPVSRTPAAMAMAAAASRTQATAVAAKLVKSRLRCSGGRLLGEEEKVRLRLPPSPDPRLFFQISGACASCLYDPVGFPTVGLA
jgi:hypothetical protein